MTEIPNGPPDGPPEFTLGEAYTSEDMYRDMGIERPSLADVPWTDMVLAVTVHVGEDQQ